MSLRTVTVTAPMGGVMPGPNQDKFDQKLPPGSFSRLSAVLGAAAPETTPEGFSWFDVS